MATSRIDPGLLVFRNRSSPSLPEPAPLEHPLHRRDGGLDGQGWVRPPGPAPVEVDDALRVLEQVAGEDRDHRLPRPHEPATLELPGPGHGRRRGRLAPDARRIHHRLGLQDLAVLDRRDHALGRANGPHGALETRGIADADGGGHGLRLYAEALAEAGAEAAGEGGGTCGLYGDEAGEPLDEGQLLGLP